MLADIRPNDEHAREHISRNPVTTNTSCIPQMSEHEVQSIVPLGIVKSHTLCASSDAAWLHLQANTTAVILANKAMNHVEGGWPKEVDCSEAEHVIRYRKKVMPMLPRLPCSTL